MIRPWIVRGYDNDYRQQRIYFFDNGYGASVIPEVFDDGFQVVQIEQTEESSFPGMSYRNSFESGSMSVNYGIMNRIWYHLSEEAVQDVLLEIRANMPA